MRLALPPLLTMSTIEAELPRLLDAAHGPDLLELDAEALVQIDTAGLQALLALVLRRRGGGLAVQWCNPAPLIKMARAAGLERALALEGAA